MAKLTFKEGPIDQLIIAGNETRVVEISREVARALDIGGHDDADELVTALDEIQGEAEEADAVLVIVVKKGEI